MKNVKDNLLVLLVMLGLCAATTVCGQTNTDIDNTIKATVAHTLRGQILEEAQWALGQQPETVTAFIADRSAGGPHDFYSEGDYWWPNPADPEGPYIRRDGQTNPDNFVAHRHAMIRFSRIVGALVSAWKITGEEHYVQHALKHVYAWFVDPDTRMNPSLEYAQAIKGLVTGRGIGIIDTIHLIDVAQALRSLAEAGVLDERMLQGTTAWFAEYLEWLTTHPYGIEEMNAKNNHGTCWVMQVAAFAKYVGDGEILRQCTERFKTVLLTEQMAPDGSFPLEIDRTKPYGYSLFNLDAMVTICHLLSVGEDNLWTYATPSGLSIRQGVRFMLPYVKDKALWPFGQDVMYWEDWPVAQPFLVLAAMAYKDNELLDVWLSNESQLTEEEVIRNVPLRYPLLWF